MVTSVQPGSFPIQNQPTENRNSKIDRSLSEAERLIFENKLTGAKATRIQGLIESAKQSASAGKVVDAERIAREALKFTRETVDESSNSSSIGTGSSPDDEDETNTIPNASEETDENREPLSDRETTSYTDASGDEGVSFQFAQPLTQAQAPFAVRQHELSHVRRDTSEAVLNGQRVMTSVRIFSRIDPKTGERHIEGGNTRIIVFPDLEPQKNLFRSENTGKNIDTKA
jgi:hypothetical protein